MQVLHAAVYQPLWSQLAGSVNLQDKSLTAYMSLNSSILLALLRESCLGAASLQEDPEHQVNYRFVPGKLICALHMGKDLQTPPPWASQQGWDAESKRSSILVIMRLSKLSHLNETLGGTPVCFSLILSRSSSLP